MERLPSGGPQLWNNLPRTPSFQWTKIMERPPSGGPQLWNNLLRADQDYGTPSHNGQDYGKSSLECTMIMERSLEWTTLWNVLPQVVKMMECPPLSAPRLWNVLPQVVKMMECPPLSAPRL